MKLGRLTLVALLGLASMRAAERVIDLTEVKPGELPKGFRSVLVGAGKPGEWKVVSDEVPSAFAPLTADAPKTTRVPVLAQVSQDPTDEHFPLLILNDEVFGDFTLTAQVKTVSGGTEQMAGIAFRLQDEKNFYVVRISTLGNTFRFYRVFNGERGNPIGPEMPIRKGAWHELVITCQGNRIRLRLDGQEPIPELTDSSFGQGKIALWTKSDSVSYFRDLRITYTPRDALAKVLVHEAMQRYPRLLGLKVFAATTGKPELHIVASTDEKELGKAGGKYERACMAENAPYTGKSDGKVIVTLPLHDRNGDPMAALRIEMRTFSGQTDQNAIARARPILRVIEGRAATVQELTE